MTRIALAAFVAAAAVPVSASPPPPAAPDAAAQATALPALFEKARQQVRLAAYGDALTTLAALDAESRKPGQEEERAKLEGSLLFYRSVCEAALGRDAEARAGFREFLARHPGSSIDPAAYPKKVVAAFEAAKRDSAATAPPSLAGSRSLMETYARFHPAGPPPAAEAGADWADGPVRYLLTGEERRAWQRLSDAASRADFIGSFWRARDPRPETAENEFRSEFERRVAFADAAFGDGERRGSLTDRGMVFVLVGPPFNVGRRPIQAGEDGSDVRGDAPTRNLDTRENMIELWHYRRENLPPKAPYPEADFRFITRRGYGANVLQREAAALSVLEIARNSSRSVS